MSTGNFIPLVVEFESGSRIEREDEPFWAGEERTFVSFRDGERVQVPSDQVVLSEQSNGSVRIGLGGMSFEGVRDGQLVFWRVKDLLPEERLPVSRGLRMTIEPGKVKRVILEGSQVWPA